MRDARHYQIAMLGLLLGWGLLRLDLAVGGPQIAVTIGAALLAQAVCQRRRGERFEPRSALISGLSLCLLLRTDALALAALAAAGAIASKFVLRVRGKHLFNPTNFALVALLLLTDRVWVSPAQWGSSAQRVFLFAGMGMLVLYRARRGDVTLAFLAAHALLQFSRAFYLGDPLSIPLRQLQAGGVLLFAFFMISDPRTLPDRRAARVLFAAAVAALAYLLQFVWFTHNPLLLALAVLSPLVPLLDRLLPGERFQWTAADPRVPAFAASPTVPATQGVAAMSPRLAAHPFVARVLVLAGAFALLGHQSLSAFCGFYVAKADTKLFNRSSQVVLVRDGNRTVITMANDYQGAPEEFAMVVPVPTFIEREQIHVASQGLVDHLDAFTAPRLVEYYDENPCALRERDEDFLQSAIRQSAAPAARADGQGVRVRIEARYTVGEYDILILSADESQALEAWLRANGYHLPPGASAVLGSYLRQGMRFFVAKVNLGEQSRLAFQNLRPLQIAFESPKFMLPIRLGTVNANGPQELFVYTLTRTGRVETTNYRTVRLPTDATVPVFVKNEFGGFYRALFDHQTKREQMSAVFLEYAWDMAWCDPCAADPLSSAELRELGVFWQDGVAGARGAGPQNVFVTRLHVRYDGQRFPEDLKFQETGDRANFQGRYVLRHAWTGSDRCPAADSYRAQLRERWQGEVRALADLTGWDPTDIRRRAGLPESAAGEPAAGEPWWRRLWPGR